MSVIQRWLGWTMPATPRERAAALWSFAYFFTLLAGYYVLRPLRDQMGIAGGVKKATGSVKKAIGKATGDRNLEADGRADKAEGRVRSAVGKAKDAVREITGRR